ncbi:AAA family ATPase [uncultured Dubosiella sp.]|uniref:AAA family ATPase n=1 Tax=uncultured Dubosiella sp. TaxID=1937011 RepID=UPI0034276233
MKGCRQCGKTYSVLDFAKKNYENVIYLNFFENPDYASVFSGSLNMDSITLMISALLGKKQFSKKTGQFLFLMRSRNVRKPGPH